MALPNFIIVGAQKAATTFLQRELREHPSIYMPADETTFFEEDNPELMGREKLDLLFPYKLKGKLLGIKCPDYLARPGCAERIKSCLPDVKLVVILRDPIARLVSGYYHYVSIGLAPLKDINSGLRPIIEGHCASAYPRAKDVLEYGFYGRQLGSYFDIFPRERVLVLLYDDIRKQPESTVNNVFEFLGVDSKKLTTLKKKRPAQAIYSLPRLAFQRFRNSVLFSFDTEKGRVVFGQRFSLLGRFIFNVSNLFDRFILSRVFRNQKPTLSLELEQWLSELFLDDTRELERILDRSLRDWRVFLSGPGE